MIHIATMLPDAYGCVVANRFGKLLDDDADPFDLINEAESEKEKKKEELKSAASAKQKKPGQREPRQKRSVLVSKTSQEPLAGRKQQPRGGMVNNVTGNAAVEPQGVMNRPVLKELSSVSRRPGFREPNQEDLPKEYSIPKPSYDADFDRRGRGSFRAGRGGGRGAYSRNSEDFNPRGKREFERHSGTGKSPEDKRGGRGPYNWGSVGDTAGEVMEVTADATAKPEEDPQPSNDPQPPVEGECLVTMSLDEWKAQQEMSRPKVELNLRKADGKVPSKATVIHKSKHVENKESLEYIEEEEEGYYVRRANDITSRLDINFGSLKRPTRGRGRETREKPASPTEQRETKPSMFQKYEVAPNPDDPEDFPALTAGR